MTANWSPLIQGKPHPTGRTRELVQWNGELLARVDDADEAAVEKAIATAVKGAATMAAMPAHQRAAILESAAALLAKRADAVAEILCREAAKPMRDARSEVARCVITLKTAGEEAKRIHGEYLGLDAVTSGTGRHGITRRFPIGIVSAISPFNFPLNLPAHKVAPALAAGNAVLLKPAPRAPLSSFELVNILFEAGCPKEALAVLPGEPPAIDPLITDPRIAMVSFTGSAAVGWKIKERAAKKKVTLELGGNAAVVVHSDADLERAAARCVAGSFTYAGQVCIRSQRILVHKSARAEFTDRFLQQIAKLKIGDPLDEATELGPMIDAAAAARAWSWVGEAVAAGAKLITGAAPNGAWMQPAVLANTPRGCRARDEEIFAPVVAIDEYASFDDALDLVNDSRYGLQAGIFTNNISLLFRAFERLAVGAVIHNDVPMFRVDPMPYGGIKDSGFGREGLRHAIEDMTELRLLVVRPA